MSRELATIQALYHRLLSAPRIFFPLVGKAQSIEAFALEHRSPPRLMSRKKAAEPHKIGPLEFTIRVPVPAGTHTKEKVRRSAVES